jgi:hypothetical protein
MTKNKQHNVTITHEQWEIAQQIATDFSKLLTENTPFRIENGWQHINWTWQDVVRYALSSALTQWLDSIPPTIKEK